MPNNVGDKGHHNASSAVQPSTTDQLVDAIYQTSDGVAADLAAERTADEIATVRTQAVNAYTSTEALRSALDLCDGLIDCQIREGVVNSIDELKAIQARIRAALSGSPAPSTEGLREALMLAEKADRIHCKCQECEDGAQAPEACEHCFPSADDARVARRNVLKALGVKMRDVDRCAPDAARTALAGITAPQTGSTD